MDAEQFQKFNGLTFRQPDLLNQSLTHRSYINEHPDSNLIDNERLEFLGDAVLDFVTGDMLFRRFPDMPEGDLTRLRAALVRTESLASLAIEAKIGQSLRMGKGEEASGGRNRPSNLCGAFEAVVGAIYLDQGLQAAIEFVMPRLEKRLSQVLAESLDKDARSVLQEKSQADYNLTPVYNLVSASGPDHDRQFTFEVVIGDQVAGRGVGHSKQAAAQMAAREALQALENGTFKPPAGG
jgi:ribonuclease-3